MGLFLIICTIVTAPRCDVPEAPYGDVQRRLMAPRPAYTDFFTSTQLPRAEDLPSYYFIEDISLPEALFSKDKLSTTRQRLRQLFEHYIYGYAPDLPQTELKLISEHSAVDVGNGVKARVRQYTLTLLLNVPGRENPVLRLALFLPHTRAEAVPVFLAINKCGNHRIAAPGVVPEQPAAFVHGDCLKEEYERTGTTAAWNVDLIISNGMALATFHESDLAADHPDKFREGVFSYFQDEHYRGPNGWRTIAIWSWGIRAVAEVLQSKINELRPDGVMLIGHSRRGKASLWAAALAPKIAAVFAHQSGTWGLALARNHHLQSREHYTQIVSPTASPVVGSQYEKILYNDFLFDHWFSDESENFKWDESRLPVDQHLLMALLAPRPVLSTEGWRDNWANYDSAWAALQEGSRYYGYLQSRGLAPEWPMLAGELQTRSEVGPLAQVRLDEEHLLTREYWKEILEFADRLFVVKKNK